jgi:hypothetical protein
LQAAVFGVECLLNLAEVGDALMNGAISGLLTVYA